MSSELERACGIERNDHDPIDIDYGVEEVAYESGEQQSTWRWRENGEAHERATVMFIRTYMEQVRNWNASYRALRLPE